MTDKLVRVIEIETNEIVCGECDIILGIVLKDVDLDQEVYCKDCYYKLKDEKEDIESKIDEVKEMLDR